MRAWLAALLVVSSVSLAPRASAGDLVDSGFEVGQSWNGQSWVVAASWPNAFQGGYALHAKNNQEIVRWPASSTFAKSYLSIRVHFRVESVNLSLDPNHDGLPDEGVTLIAISPNNASGRRPGVTLKRYDDLLVLRAEDYSKMVMLRSAQVVIGRWHVLDLLVDQPSKRLAIALDGVTVYDDPAADVITSGKLLSQVEMGVVYTQKTGHSLWFDDIRISDTRGLQGPELLATAAATPGVGKAPFTSTLSVATSGTPTVEWDFEGDGVIDATGTTVNRSYSTAGTFNPVARVTSSPSRVAVYPPVIHAIGANAPTVTLQLMKGASASLPFPRVVDLRAAATPVSGSKITQVEFDWEGDGVYGWTARTAYSDASTLTVRQPHEYPYANSSAVVRARATDSSGRVGVAELALALPTGPSTFVPAPRDPRAGIYLTYGWAEVYTNRGNAFPAWMAGIDVGAYLDWATIESTDNVFNFGPLNGSNPSTYNGRITQIVNGGKNVVLHHRRPFPAWLLTKVGKSLKKNPDGDYYPQYWDPRYQAYLQRFIQAQANNLGSLLAQHPTWAGHFVLSRGQWFAVNTENLPTGAFPIIAFPGTTYSMALTAANFTPPASGAYSVDLTPGLVAVYADNVRSFYEQAFDPYGVPSVYKPHAGGWYDGADSQRSDDEFKRAVSNKGEGFFITNARAETAQDYFFMGHTDRGFAKGFHEADDASGQPLGTAQWQYWTILSELNCGSEYVGVYGDWAWLLEYQSEYETEPIHDFVNRHVGWEPQPALAPAAWIALKQPTTPPNETFATGNYGAFLTEMPDAGTNVMTVGSVNYVYKGPGNLGHPATLNEPMKWARSCPAGQRLNFDIDDSFRNAHARAFDLEVVYHDSYQGQFFVRCKNVKGILKYFVVPMSGDGKWHKAIVPLRSVLLDDDIGPGIDFALEADAQATTFHRLVLTPL